MPVLLIFFLSAIILSSREIEIDEIAQGSEKLTAKLAVKSALEHNKNLQQFQQIIKHKQAEKYSAYGIFSPTLQYTAEGMPNNNYSQFAEKRITFSQDIDFPLVSYYRIKSINEQIESLQYEFKWKKNEVIAKTKKAYAKIIYWLEIIRLRREIMDITTKLYEIVKTKVEFGQTNELDLLNAEILKIESENDFNDAIKNLMLGRYDLFYIMGLDTDKQKYSIAFTDSLTYFDIDIKQEEILKKLETTDEYRASEIYYQSSKTKAISAWTNLFPSINLSIYKQNYSDGFNHNGFEIGFKVPLWLGLDKRTEIEQTQAQSCEAKILLNDVKLRIKKDIEHSWHSYEISRSVIQKYKNQVSEKSQRLLDLTIESYQLGQTDLLNLLNVQKGYINSKIRYLDALLDYYVQTIDLEKYLENEIVFTN